MKSMSLRKILGGSIGFIVGLLGGAYLGLILGGTFLGGFDIYENYGIEGYEITTYVGAVIGAVVCTIWGMKLAQRMADKRSA